MRDVTSADPIMDAMIVLMYVGAGMFILLFVVHKWLSRRRIPQRKSSAVGKRDDV